MPGVPSEKTGGYSISRDEGNRDRVRNKTLPHPQHTARQEAMDTVARENRCYRAAAKGNKNLDYALLEDKV